MSARKSASRKSRWWWLAAVPLTLVLGLVLVFAFLDPIATYATRRALGTLKGFSTDFADVSLKPFPLTYEIARLKLVEEPALGAAPLWYAEKTRIELSFLNLLRGRIVGNARIESPKISYVIRKPVQQEIKETQAKLEPPFRRLAKALESLPPSRIERVEVVDGEMVVEDHREPNRPRFWVHGMDASMENFASNRALSRGRATVIAGSATLMKTGQTSLFISADPLTLPPHFAGRFQVDGLQLADLHQVLASKTGIALPKGEFGLFASFKTEQGHLEGGIKPVLEGMDAKPAEKGIGPKIKAALADVTIDLLKSKDGEEKVATVIPIRGNLNGPEVQVWPSILGVVRNAFVEGLSGAFTNTPPPVSKKDQNAIEQAVDALRPGKESPKAQPAGK